MNGDAMNGNYEIGLVSVILPLYRVFDYVGEVIDSLKAQTYAKFECLCLDDGSGNEMTEVVRKKIADDDRFRLYEFENAGMAESRNRGLALARGEFVAFIDQDDGYHPRFLQEALEALQQYDADCTVCMFREIDQDESVSDFTVADRGLTVDWAVIDEPAVFLLKTTNLDLNNVWQKVFRRSSLGDLRFRKDLFGADDACFSLEAFLRFQRIVFTRSQLHYYRQHGGSVTSQGNARYVFSKLALPGVVAPLIPDKYRDVFLEAGLRQISRGVKDAVEYSLTKSTRRQLLKAVRNAFQSIGVSFWDWRWGAKVHYLRLLVKCI